jgi:hypothetical protein
MENRDNEDPESIRRDTDVTSESIEVEPNERVEIVLVPNRAMRSPILRMSSSCRDSKVLVEQIVHSRRTAWASCPAAPVTRTLTRAPAGPARP